MPIYGYGTFLVDCNEDTGKETIIPKGGEHVYDIVFDFKDLSRDEVEVLKSIFFEAYEERMNEVKVELVVVHDNSINQMRYFPIDDYVKVVEAYAINQNCLGIDYIVEKTTVDDEACANYLLGAGWVEFGC